MMLTANIAARQIIMPSAVAVAAEPILQATDVTSNCRRLLLLLCQEIWMGGHLISSHAFLHIHMLKKSKTSVCISRPEISNDQMIPVCVDASYH